MRIVTGSQMQEIDRRATRELGIPSLTLMENAGRGVADLIASFLHPGGVKRGFEKSIVIFCGKGNNGGDGLVAARYLAERGYPVRIILFCDPSELKKDPAVNFQKLSSLNIPIHVDGHYENFLEKADLIVDALFGVGLKKALSEPFHSAVVAINNAKKKVISIDVPSGLDADTGRVFNVCVEADMTATLQLPKKGLYEGEGPRYAGTIKIIDIGIPEELLND